MGALRSTRARAAHPSLQVSCAIVVYLIVYLTRRIGGPRTTSPPANESACLNTPKYPAGYFLNQISRSRGKGWFYDDVMSRMPLSLTLSGFDAWFAMY